MFGVLDGTCRDVFFELCAACGVHIPDGAALSPGYVGRLLGRCVGAVRDLRARCDFARSDRFMSSLRELAAACGERLRSSPWMTADTCADVLRRCREYVEKLGSDAAGREEGCPEAVPPLPAERGGGDDLVERALCGCFREMARWELTPAGRRLLASALVSLYGGGRETANSV